MTTDYYENKRHFVRHIRNQLQVLIGDNDIEIEKMAERLFEEAKLYAAKKNRPLRLMDNNENT